MGFKRFLRRAHPLVHTIDTIKNIVEEQSIKDGLIRTGKENYFEDNPLTSTFYKAGKYDGKIEGYNEASTVYEGKLFEQAQEFLKQKELAKDQVKAYEKLLDEYENLIEELSNKINKTEEENRYLQQLLMTERQLRKLQVG